MKTGTYHHTDLEQIIKMHCDAAYKRDIPSRIKKLGEEYGELAEAVAHGDPDAIAEEAADMALILLDIAQLNNHRGGSLEQHVIEKLVILKARGHGTHQP